MPKYLKQNGDEVPNVIIEKSYIVIPVIGTNTPINEETYLIPPRVADYILLLESKLEELPKLPPNDL